MALLRIWKHGANSFVDSNMARDAFATFIPLSVDSDARTKIIFDFFDLLSAIVAHAKTNGFGGRKLSRLAGWWAFEHSDNKNGFEGGYKTWIAYVIFPTSYIVVILMGLLLVLRMLLAICSLRTYAPYLQNLSAA